MSLTMNDVNGILQDEMGMCPHCHDHTPCGCEPVEDDDYDLTPVSGVLTNAITRLNNLIGDYSV